MLVKFCEGSLEINPLMEIDYCLNDDIQSTKKVPVYFIDNIDKFEVIAKSWLNEDCLAIDTEFERRTTYYATLALVQIFDGKAIYLVDSLVTDCPDSLKHVFENPNIVKILHSSKEDLEVLYTAWQCRLNGLFDTQVAYSFLHKELSIGYSKLVEAETGNILDKQATTSDWIKRPLSIKQFEYAAKDVLYLVYLFEKLNQQLQDKIYKKLFVSECKEYCSGTYLRVDNLPDFREAKEVWKLNEIELAFFKQLFYWREEKARQENRTKNHIINDQDLVCLCQMKPKSIGELKQISNIHPRSIRLYGADWVRMIDDWSNNNKTSIATIPNPRDVNQLKILSAKIERVVKQLAESNHIPATLLLSKRLIRKLAFAILTNTSMPAQWQGWRKNILSEIVDETSKAFVNK